MFSIAQSRRENMEKSPYMLPNPIYYLIEDRIRKELSQKYSIISKGAAPRGRRRRGDNNSKKYHIIELKGGSTPIVIGGVEYYPRTNHPHHVSVYEFIKPTETQGLSAYHYTGVFSEPGGGTITVHVYFKKNGEYASCQVKDSQGREVKISADEAKSLKRYAEAISIELISDITVYAQQATNNLEEDFKKVSDELDDLSKKVNFSQLNPSDTHVSTYMRKLNGCLTLLDNLRKYSLHPQLSKRKLLKEIFYKLKENIGKFHSQKNRKTRKAATMRSSSSTAYEGIKNKRSQKRGSEDSRLDLKKQKEQQLSAVNKALEAVKACKNHADRILETENLLDQKIVLLGADDAEILISTCVAMNKNVNAAKMYLGYAAITGDITSVRKLLLISPALDFDKYFFIALKSRPLTKEEKEKREKSGIKDIDNRAITYSKILKLVIDKFKPNIHMYCPVAGREYEALIACLGYNLLMTAVRSKNMPMAKMLIDKGARLDFRNVQTGETALMRAAQGGCVELARLLLENGADPNIRVPKINRSCFTNVPELAKKLAQYKPGNSECGRTALHYATDCNADMVRLFLNPKYKIDLTLRGMDGFTAFGYSATQCKEKPTNFEIVDLFLEKGVGIDEKQGPGCSATPLFYACQYGQLNNVKELIKRGANPNEPGPCFSQITRGERIPDEAVRNSLVTPLMVAVCRDRRSVVEYLLGQTKMLVTIENACNAYNYAGMFKHKYLMDLIGLYISEKGRKNNIDYVFKMNPG